MKENASDAVIIEAITELAQAYPDRAGEAEALGNDLHGELAALRGKEDAVATLTSRMLAAKAKCGAIERATSSGKEQGGQKDFLERMSKIESSFNAWEEAQRTPTTSGSDLASIQRSLEQRVRSGEITLREMRDMMDRHTLQRRLEAKESLLRAKYTAKEDAPKLSAEERMAKARAQVKKEQEARVEKEEEAARTRARKIRELTDQVTQLRLLRAEQSEASANMSANTEHQAVREDEDKEKEDGDPDEGTEASPDAESSPVLTLQWLGGTVVLLGALFYGSKFLGRRR